MRNGVTMKLNADDYIIMALKEDITSEDITTNSILREKKLAEAELICKQDCLLAGIWVFERVFKILDQEVCFETKYKDGDTLKSGQVVGVLRGDARTILSGERTALNYLQRMSGIATLTKEMVDQIENSDTKLLDTRKTTPNMRSFEKYAVKVGGGVNHRFNLSDGVLLKDNHIAAAGGIEKAIELARDYAPFVRKIEVETETLEMVRDAVAAGADIIMLDNMDDEMVKAAVELIDGCAATECSGNITKDRIKKLAEIGVDYISVGALTHSATVVDFSLKNLKLI